MRVPVGFLATFLSFLRFLPFFFLLLILGLVKAVIICPFAVCIIAIGNSAVIIGLWIAHFVWTFYCVGRTRRIGLVLKIVVLFLLPLPLVLWPVIGIVGSVVGGIGYGFLNPLIATFEAVGESVKDKFYHCFLDGCESTIKGSCTVVRDFTDFCFHSCFSYMDELSDKVPGDQKPMDIKLSKLPSCLLVILIAVPIDVLLITAVALWKSPYMLFRGWKRLLEDLIGREGPFLETVCVPFAALALVLWPLAVVASVIGAIISSFFLGLYSAVIVQQEGSLRMGLAYIIAVVSEFDEYVNDLLYLSEGSKLPRPKYRKSMDLKTEESNKGSSKTRRENSMEAKLSSERSRTLKWAVQQYKPVHVWDWLFKSSEENGRKLLQEGILSMKDIEDFLVKGNLNKLDIKLPACSILQCLLISAKSDSSGLVISDNAELTRSNAPRDKLFEWLIGPLMVMKEQIRKLELDEKEEKSLRGLVIRGKNETPEEWDETEFPSKDNVKRGQLQGIIRRLEGIITMMTRIPTFRRRFNNLVKLLYVEAIQINGPTDQIERALKSKRSGNFLMKGGSWKGRERRDEKEKPQQAFDSEV